MGIPPFIAPFFHRFRVGTGAAPNERSRVDGVQAAETDAWQKLQAPYGVVDAPQENEPLARAMAWNQ